MVDAAVKAGRILMTAFNHRQRGDVQVLKRYIDAGSLGRLSCQGQLDRRREYSRHGQLVYQRKTWPAAAR